MKFEILNPFILMLFVIFKLNTCAFGWIKTSFLYKSIFYYYKRAETKNWMSMSVVGNIL